MPYRIIDEADAPPKTKTKSVSNSANYFRDIISQLEPGKVAELEPTPDSERSDKSLAQGLKISLKRVANGMGVKIDSWNGPDDKTVYVKRLED